MGQNLCGSDSDLQVMNLKTLLDRIRFKLLPFCKTKKEVKRRTVIVENWARHDDRSVAVGGVLVEDVLVEDVLVEDVLVVLVVAVVCCGCCINNVNLNLLLLKDTSSAISWPPHRRRGRWFEERQARTLSKQTMMRVQFEAKGFLALGGRGWMRGTAKD